MWQSIAGRDKIKVVKSLNGYERPVIVGDLDDATVDRIFDICPGTRIEGLPKNEIVPETMIDNVWGPWLRIVRAWAVNTPPVDPSNRVFGLPAQALTILSHGPQTLSIIVSGTISFFGRPSIRVPGQISKILSTVASSRSPTITGRSYPFNDLTTFILSGPAID
jgi:coenzyme F420 hydrogenase subunit beta